MASGPSRPIARAVPQERYPEGFGWGSTEMSWRRAVTQLEDGPMMGRLTAVSSVCGWTKRMRVAGRVVRSGQT